jgi:hypothetical protein
MIFVFAEGGTGSVFFSRQVNVAVRPDTVFGFEADLKEFPAPVTAKAWKARSGVDLDVQKTIEQNLVRMCDIRETVFKQHTMLCGRCSQTSKFLTDNQIEATCIVRHPLHAFVSFFSQRHPEHVAHLGGFNTESAVRWYASMWNAMLADFIESGNVIYRFEYMPDEILEDWLKTALRHWNNTLRNYDKIEETHLEDLLEAIVEKNFYALYDDWKI